MQSGVCPSGSKKNKSQNKPFSRPTYPVQPGVCPAGSKTHFWISKNSFSSSMEFHAVWRLSIWFERKCQHTRFSVYGTSFRLEFLHVAKMKQTWLPTITTIPGRQEGTGGSKLPGSPAVQWDGVSSNHRGWWAGGELGQQPCNYFVFKIFLRMFKILS